MSTSARSGVARRRAAVVLAVLIVAAAAASTRAGRPLRRVANVDAGRASLNTPRPLTTVPVDARGLRRAAEIVGSGRVYLETDAHDVQLTAHDLPGVATLYFLPAVLTDDPARADWVVRYHSTRRLPRGRVWRVSHDVTVVKVAR